ncbi:MAG: hypothetical protein WC658_00465 [Candidatus Omnitrophota bacterium]
MKENIAMLKKFIRKWRSLSVIEDREFRNSSMKQRLDQLAAVVCLGLGLGFSLKEDKEKLSVRARWIALKKSVK